MHTKIETEKGRPKYLKIICYIIYFNNQLEHKSNMLINLKPLIGLN